MSYDEEGAFGARTTFYGSRWARCVLVVVLALDSVARHVHLPVLYAHHDGPRADSIRIPRSSKISFITCDHSLTQPVVIERYAVHMLVFFFFFNLRNLPCLIDSC